MAVEERERAVVYFKAHSDRSLVLRIATHSSFDFADVRLFNLWDRLSLSEKPYEAALHSLTLIESVLFLAVEYVILFTSCIHSIREQLLPLSRSCLFIIHILFLGEEVTNRFTHA
jgi:hypothetical protein